jgi:hypothetical protein
VRLKLWRANGHVSTSHQAISRPKTHDLAPPTRDEAKPARARSFGMFPTGLHRKNLADAKAALLVVTGKDNSSLKDQAANLVVVGVDFAELVRFHFPVHDLTKTVIAQLGFKAGCIHFCSSQSANPFNSGSHSTIPNRASLLNRRLAERGAHRNQPRHVRVVTQEVRVQVHDELIFQGMGPANRCGSAYVGRMSWTIRCEALHVSTMNC